MPRVALAVEPPRLSRALRAKRWPRSAASRLQRRVASSTQTVPAPTLQRTLSQTIVQECAVPARRSRRFEPRPARPAPLHLHRCESARCGLAGDALRTPLPRYPRCESPRCGLAGDAWPTPFREHHGCESCAVLRWKFLVVLTSRAQALCVYETCCHESSDRPSIAFLDSSMRPNLHLWCPTPACADMFVPLRASAKAPQGEFYVAPARTRLPSHLRVRRRPVADGGLVWCEGRTQISLRRSVSLSEISDANNRRLSGSPHPASGTP